MGQQEGVGFRLGYALVDEVVHKEFKKMGGGLHEGSKSEYDSIKKKLSSEPLQPLWREEIAADSIRPQSQPTRSAAADKEPAQKVVEVQAKTKALPEDSKPEVGKRKAANDKDEA